jgi:hypothetical protein
MPTSKASPKSRKPAATPTSKSEAKASAKQQRAAAAKQVADDRKAKKLHVIAERRAAKAKMTKAQYIAEIVKGRFAPITAEDLANEPDPE